jgi:hypothetical protein
MVVLGPFVQPVAWVLAFNRAPVLLAGRLPVVALAVVVVLTVAAMVVVARATRRSERRPVVPGRGRR